MASYTWMLIELCEKKVAVNDRTCSCAAERSMIAFTIYLCMRVRSVIAVCKYIYIYTRMCIGTCTCMFVCICVYAYGCVYACVSLVIDRHPDVRVYVSGQRSPLLVHNMYISRFVTL